MTIGPDQPSRRLPKLAIAAAVVAFLLAAGNFVSAIRAPLFVAAAIVPAVAGVTILRRRIWGAYGFAVFTAAQLVVLTLALSGDSGPKNQSIVVGVLGCLVAVLFFLAGRSLQRSDGIPGRAWPWLLVTFLFTAPFFFVHAYFVPTGAMEDTLLIGDRIVARVRPAVVPQRGEIIVLRLPTDRRQLLIKRVIGVPGDTIRVTAAGVYRNGAALNEPYAVHKFNIPVDQIVSTNDSVVPPGKYFVLGDSRDNSLDSRHWGFLNASDVVGKALFIYSSAYANNGEESQPGAGKIRWERIFKVIK